ncbi:MAG: alpha/beta hydrolase [Rhizobiales bacterium]|nr:alpha/beta hydrolase [Hyphomicrobiales bacterium]MBO6698538.1 alpha/beta hydrolase [Hyphomicrobiales bacterium]MBO6735208.1 alpha/beta hydrolase [Hyphomicrobiales bacterium]MBO6910984.1 alpha/beta hydrolase [Hyphomicrobiales bacterium]MBO6956027.1 alpha/beta hydrolase [Hyphomicrobiales bacterium]
MTVTGPSAMIDPVRILSDAPYAETFFDGFDEKLLSIDGSEVFIRIGGSGPAILLLHGYPQTSAMWHKIAPVLAERYTVVCADLRGYGRSAKPTSDAHHNAYSKRAMATDLVGAMNSLGHERFLIGAHDRGARVAHRLAADHPDKVLGLATLDIAPTREMYADATSAFAAAYWHWYWLIQPSPMPEQMIGADPDYFWCKKCCSGSAGALPFDRQALNEYLAAFRDPAVIHASCEDYRAAYGVDIAHDDDDPQPLPMPVLALWGDKGAIEAHFNCLSLWRKRASDVRGRSLPGGHYLAEECPGAVLAEWLPFFNQIVDAGAEPAPQLEAANRA